MPSEEHAAQPAPFDPAVTAALFGGAMAGVAVLDTGLRYLYVNPALERLNGVSAAAHLGRPVFEVLPEIEARVDVLRKVLADGQAREITYTGQTWAVSDLEQRYWHGAYHRLESEDGKVVGLVAIVLDISASEIRNVELKRARGHLALLDTAAVSIGTTLDMDTTCQELCDVVVPVLADVATVEVFPPDVGNRVRHAPQGVVRMRRAALASVPGLRDLVDQFSRPGEYIDYQEDAAVPRCLASNASVKVNFRSDEEFGAWGPAPERAAAYRAIGIHSALVVPLTARGLPQGALSLARAAGSPPFTDEDVLVARELAGRAAVDLEHARRYAHEHSIARELQRSLLSEPSGPHPHVEIASRYLSAEQGALVGGDWFDVIPLGNGRHLKAIGDVMGHGVEASVAMSHYRSLLRLLAYDDLPPHEILEQLDRMVERSGTDRAATCLIAVVDRAVGVCELASAGHLPPVFIDPGLTGRLVEVPVGPPLGTGFGGYRSTTVPCGPGTVLFMYTDGLVERRGEDIDVSVGRLSGLAMPVSGKLVDLLDEVLDRFGQDAEDDIAVMASRTLR
ncbi:SpoIIE family protein phosphatase [Streptomyces sp. NBC_00234]|uniref:SpoIIE family protein phosphatase n=1 Tax=Streptomyces sp. NBC_00234 TaxID=2903638 RepID=UPI002E2C663A|nr:SpoIIE family protein phosphatase [Streptomyces sp. NBC_00234]